MADQPLTISVSVDINMFWTRKDLLYATARSGFPFFYCECLEFTNTSPEVKEIMDTHDLSSLPDDPLSSLFSLKRSASAMTRVQYSSDGKTLHARADGEALSTNHVLAVWILLKQMVLKAAEKTETTTKGDLRSTISPRRFIEAWETVIEPGWPEKEPSLLRAPTMVATRMATWRRTEHAA